MPEKYSLKNLFIHFTYLTLKILDKFFVSLKAQDAITNITMSNRLIKTLSSIDRLGIKLNNIFDIGAYRGEFSLKLNKLFPNYKFYMFESNFLHEEILKKLPFNSYIVTLSDKKK